MEKQIETFKREIEELKRDMHYVKNQVSIGALDYQIKLRELSILEIETDRHNVPKG